MTNTTIQQWLKVYYGARQSTERMGEAFVNDHFETGSWTNLYHADNEKSLDLIIRFLIDCDLYPNCPKVRNK